MTKHANSLIGGMQGTKAVSVGDLDDFLDWLIDDDGTAPQELYAAVAWTFWCVNLRANSVAGIPFGVYPKGMKRADFKEDNAVDFDIDLRPFLWSAEAWLLLKGAGYWLKRSNAVTVKELQILNSNTMKVWRWDADGPTVFRQTIGADHRDWPAEDIVYFRTFNPRNDIREGIASGRVGALPALLVKSVNEWAEAFFRNGAVPLTLLMADGTINTVEQDRITKAWQQFLQGVKRAFTTVVLQKGMKVEVIGQPVKDLAMPEMEVTKKHQILAAHMIPPGYAEAKTNRAERWALQFELFTDAIIPECENRIVPVVNEQYLDALDLQLGYRYNEIEALQRAEITKAESASFIMSGVMLPSYVQNVVSVEETRRVADALLQMAALPGLDESFTPEERAPLDMAPAGDSNENTPPGGGDAPGQSPPPKALAPEWGHLRASLQNSDAGETRQPSAASRATLTVT